MLFGRMIMGVAGLAMAGSAQAAALSERLPLSLAALGSGGEVTYQPRRWLTIRRSIAPAMREIFREESYGGAPIAPLRTAQALTGDIHPFGDGVRLLLGLREQNNRRALRMNGDGGDVGTERYRPLIAIGYAGEVSPGLSIGADIGMLGRSMAYGQGVELVTPIDQAAQRENGAGPILQISAGYRF